MSNLAHRLKIQNDINTDYIIPAKYKFKTFDNKELSKHLFEDIESEFNKRIKTGDFLIAGDNFGCGSSKEQAPVALKTSGLGAVIAKSYARIFYRNSFNIGFCLIECDTRFIDDMDEVEVDFEKNIVKNMTKGLNIDMKPIPNVMRRILDKGGVIEYFKEKKSFDELA